MGNCGFPISFINCHFLTVFWMASDCAFNGAGIFFYNPFYNATIQPVNGMHFNLFCNQTMALVIFADNQ